MLCLTKKILEVSCFLMIKGCHCHKAAGSGFVKIMVYQILIVKDVVAHPFDVQKI